GYWIFSCTYSMRIDADCVNVKAKTNEKLGFEGQELGVVAQAVVLLEKA
ncbi:2-C-methyl-D-erythritol 2,4-cyclodiphosphate synthase, partial [Turicimonas muris]